MNAQTRWIILDGAVNVRDLGGLTTAKGATTRFGQVLRADNLQGLTPRDVTILTNDLGLRNVIDLRSDAEVRLEGPGPLTRHDQVTIHHLSLFTEGGRHTDVEADLPPEQPEQPEQPEGIDLDKILPWQTRQDRRLPEQERSIAHYLGYLRERPDSVVDALRVIAHRAGASIVHCAAGKDRTGVVCAFALEAAGVQRKDVVADYVRTGERLEAILQRLRSSPTYAADLDQRPADSHLPRAYIMEKFLATVDERHDGVTSWLRSHGWTPDDQAALRTRLIA
jgi:protein tyrosine/serine phosphatase